MAKPRPSESSAPSTAPSTAPSSGPSNTPSSGPSNAPPGHSPPSRPGCVAFASLGLSAEVLRAVEQLGFDETSPIQSAAIPLIMAGHDVVGQSQTGSGKTAAFAIPAVERVRQGTPGTRVLILAPTRELATQITDDVRRISAFTKGVRAVAIYGGASYERQFAELGRGAQIVVGTPGRLTDHMARGTLDLSAVQLLVLDEADRMLDMGFREDIEKIVAATPSGRQTVFFSATISPPVESLVRGHSRDARKVTIGRKTGADAVAVDQMYYEVRHHAKADALFRLVDFHDVKSGVIFCNTQSMVENLAAALAARGCSAERLHGGMPQPQRTRVMEAFKRAAFRLLVATDVAARGIDVNDLELVVNYDLPFDPEDYVHRIGRTGRAGRKGRAVTLVSGAGLGKLQAIERFTNTRIRREPVPTAEAIDRRRADVLVSALRETLAAGDYQKQPAVLARLVEEGHAPADVAAALLHHLAGQAPQPARAAAPPPPPADRGDTERVAAKRPVHRREGPRQVRRIKPAFGKRSRADG